MSNNNKRKGSSKSASGREYVSKGVSALPEWWEEVEAMSKQKGVGRSFLIREAVDRMLADIKGKSAEMKRTPLQIV